MLRQSVLLGLLLVSSTANAGPADDAAAAKAIRDALDAPIRWEGQVHNLAPDAIVIDRDGGLVKDGDLGARWYGGDLDTDGFDDQGGEEGSMKVVALTTRVDAKLDVWVDPAKGVGYFRGTLTVDGTNLQTGDEVVVPPMPMTGILVENRGWKIAALVLTKPIPDKTLITRASKGSLVPTTTPASIRGHMALAAAATDWFGKGFSGKGAPKAKLAAIGTAPKEMQTGAGTAKLAKAWDGLKLRATSIEAKVFKSAIGFVRAEVLMPLKKGGKAAPLVLGAIALFDGKDWRWVSLQFATPHAEDRGW